MGEKFDVGTRVRLKMPGINGTVIEVYDEPGFGGEYLHVIETEDGERLSEPQFGSNLEPIRKAEPAKSGLDSGGQSKSVVEEGELALIAGGRLAELRGLVSSDFDFKKLIRLCEELNTAYHEKCCFATAMLTRALLDHVPPIFAKKNFEEVASSYGGRSFKGTTQHLQNASRNVADGYLHQQIRKSETLPTPQQVNCGQQLDALLEEIIRMTREKNPTP
jgi:hypothetical protein